MNGTETTPNHPHEQEHTMTTENLSTTTLNLDRSFVADMLADLGWNYHEELGAWFDSNGNKRAFMMSEAAEIAIIEAFDGIGKA